jgi:hypothetical protein
MFYIDSRNPAVLARKDEANWVFNRLVEADVTSLPDDFLEYHRQTRSPYDGVFLETMEASECLSSEEWRRFVLEEASKTIQAS